MSNIFDNNRIVDDDGLVWIAVKESHLKDLLSSTKNKRLCHEVKESSMKKKNNNHAYVFLLTLLLCIIAIPCILHLVLTYNLNVVDYIVGLPRPFLIGNLIAVTVIIILLIGRYERKN